MFKYLATTFNFDNFNVILPATAVAVTISPDKTALMLSDAMCLGNDGADDDEK
jgi:hypothetical protein